MSLSAIPFDPELTPGARNAVRACLRVQPGEKVTLIADRESAGIAAAIARELDEVGANARHWLLARSPTCRHRSSMTSRRRR